ncbi:MAG: hypothetical protein HW386_301 [Gammaproteobacteria bacterium]|nr:hypothetical protein [Gammaproteobacteria bacterium]
MRWVFIVFLLLNVVYFGWELDRQIQLDRRNAVTDIHPAAEAQTLKLITEGDPQPKIYQKTAAAGSGSESIFVLPADNQLVADLPEITTVTMDTLPGNFFCYTFGPIEEEILATGIGDWFNSRRAETNIRFSDEKGRQLFWIYLAPQESGHDARDLMSDLKDKGVKDYRLISKGEMQSAISLGLYSGHDELNERIGELKQQGYQPIVVPYDDGKRVYWVDVRLSMNPDTLALVFKGYPSRYRYVPVECSKIGMLATAP